MVSFTIEEAAEFLKMSREGLRQKAVSGKVPAQKVGKRWVFIREHLADFVSGRYTPAREGLRVLEGGLSTSEQATWQSTKTKKATTGTSTSLTQTANEYADLLGLKTSSKHKNCTTV